MYAVDKKRDSKTADVVSLREALAKGSFGSDLVASSGPGSGRSGSPGGAAATSSIMKKRKDSKPGLGIDASLAAQLNRQSIASPPAAAAPSTTAAPASKPPSAEQLLAQAAATDTRRNSGAGGRGELTIKKTELVDEPDWGDDATDEKAAAPTGGAAPIPAPASNPKQVGIRSPSPKVVSADGEGDEDWDEEMKKDPDFGGSGVAGAAGAGAGAADSLNAAAARPSTAPAKPTASATSGSAPPPAAASAASTKRSIDDFKEKDSDEDEEEWDAKPASDHTPSAAAGGGSGVEPSSPRTPGKAHGGLTLDDSDDENERDEVPKKYRMSHLLSQQSHKPVNIIMFPSPSTLYSLHTTEGRSALSERALEQFLKDIVTKYEYRFTPRTADMPVLDLPWNATKELVVPPGSASAAPTPHSAGSASNTPAHHHTPSTTPGGTHSLAHIEQQLPATLKRVLARAYRLHRAIGGSGARNATALLKCRTELWRISADVFTFLEKNAATRYVTDWGQDETVFATVHSLLYLNAKNWSRDNGI